MTGEVNYQDFAAYRTPSLPIKKQPPAIGGCLRSGDGGLLRRRLRDRLDE
jgi:hypothetical protein